MNLFIWTSPANNKNHSIFFKFTVVRKRIVVLNAEVMGPSTMNVMYPQKVRILKRIHHPDVQFILSVYTFYSPSADWLSADCYRYLKLYGPSTHIWLPEVAAVGSSSTYLRRRSSRCHNIPCLALLSCDVFAMETPARAIQGRCALKGPNRKSAGENRDPVRGRWTIQQKR